MAWTGRRLEDLQFDGNVLDVGYLNLRYGVDGCLGDDRRGVDMLPGLHCRFITSLPVHRRAGPMRDEIGVSEATTRANPG